MPSRRRFLEGTGAALAAALAVPPASAAAASTSSLPSTAPSRDELAADLVICGAGLGGIAAALAALRLNRTVILTEPTLWIGGQLTSQAVPPDEHPWIEQFGASSSYRALRSGIRDHYRRHYPLTAEAAASPRLNPGRGSVSALCAEPRAALAVLTAQLAPYLSSGRLLLLLQHLPVRAEVQADRLQAVIVRHVPSGDECSLTAPYFIDATELGDLLPLAGAEFVTGAEGRDQTGEPHAPAEPQPENHQAFTVCFAIEHRPGEDHSIDRPDAYDFWSQYTPDLQPPWPGRLLDWSYSMPITLEPKKADFDPTPPGNGLWVYRRIIDPASFQPGTYPGSHGVTLVNWPQNDYWLGNLMPPAGAFENPEPGQIFGPTALHHLNRARQLSRSLLYWLQTDAPRPDGGTGWKGLKLRGDLLGTSGLDHDPHLGLALHPYIREARRLRAEFTVTEPHVGTEARRHATGQPDLDTAEPFPDSVGLGSYRIDLHPGSGGVNYVDVSSMPFQIPLGALIPVRIDNLLPAAKNLGTTHITNGCYRLHPVEWAIGEAAGAVAAVALDHAETPRAIRNTPARLADYQRTLRALGVETHWPRPTPR